MSKKQRTERILIFILPIFITLLTGVFLETPSKMDISDGMEFLKTMIGVYSTLLGFAITAESILIAFQGGEYTQLIIRAGHLKTVLFSFVLTNISLFWGLIFYVVLIMGNSWNTRLEKTVFCSMVLIFIYFGISILYFSIMLFSQKK